MELSTSERQWVARWTKSQRTWFVQRWVVLLVALVFWVATLLIIVRLCTSGERIGIPMGFVAFEVATFHFMNLGSVALAVYVFSRWNGDRRLSLLLKLVQMHEKKIAQPGSASNRS